MKKLLFAAAILVAASAPVHTQTPQGATGQPAGRKAVSAEEEVAGFERAWIKAWMSGDSKAMDGLLADDHVDITVEGKVNTKADNLGDVRAMAQAGKSAPPTRLDEMRVKLYGDTAVVTSRVNMSVTTGGGAAGADTPVARLLSVWVRRQGRWLSVAHQATSIPGPAKAQ